MCDLHFTDNHLIKDYEEFNSRSDWNNLFQRIKNKSSIKIGTLECSIARNINNRSKNIFREVVPYNFNRVILSKSLEDESDYINGSHINLYGRPYIVTQYPNKQTMKSFWKMVWQSNITGIIMLGQLYEDDNTRYFPGMNDEVVIYRDEDEEEKSFFITIKEEIFYNGFIQRRLHLHNMEVNEEIELWHFEFWSWPDQSVPRCMDCFLTFLGVVRQYDVVGSSLGSPVVHCSAGAGRSGTFCLIDIAIMMMERDGHLSNVDIPGLMEDLRAQRMGMVRSFKQLKFCYEAIMEAFRRYGSSNKLNRGYLFAKEEPHFCVNGRVKTTSSSSSDDVDLDSDMYGRLCDGRDVISDGDDDQPAPTSQDLDDGRNESIDNDDLLVPLMNENNVESQRLHRQKVIYQRKIRNYRKITRLSKHLDENHLRRHRLVSLGFVEEVGRDHFQSLMIVTSAVVFLGTIFWFRYTASKCGN